MKAVLSIIFVCFFWVSKSQETKIKRILTGDITAQQSVGYARVYVSLNNKVLGYTFADEKGYFVVEYQTDKDSVVLNISRIGFKKKVLKISTDIKYIKAKLDVSDKTEFKEIVVTADKKAIIDRGDTIKYAVSAFADGTEINAEDILAKLPGITVDKKSGKIKYQGKEIKKILLDGDDLTDNNYKVLSKNLAAEWLDEVEILQHFTDTRLYHGIKKSEEIAINLRLKEDAKAPLFGSVEVGIGGWRKPDKYLAKAELLSYLKKLKIFTHGEMSNTGVDIEAYSMESYMSSQLKYKGFLGATPYLNDQLYLPDFFKKEFFTFNQGQFLSNSFIFKPSNKTSVKNLTTLYHNDQNFNFSNYIRYLFPDNSISSFFEEQFQNQIELNLFQDLKIEHQISKSKDITTRFQIKKKNNNLDTKNYSDSLNDINSLSNTGDLELFASVSYINKFANNWVSTTKIEVGAEKFEENFRFDSITSLQNINVGLQNIAQNYYNLSLSTEVNGVALKSWYLSVSTGILRTSSDILASVQGINNFDYSLLYHKYVISSLNSGVLIDKKIKFLKFSLGARLRNLLIEYKSSKKTETLIEPTISVLMDKKIADLLYLKIKTLYNFEYSFIEPYQLIKAPLFTNYRTINSFQADAFVPSKNNILTASIQVRENRKSNITALAQWLYLTSENILTDNITYPLNIEYNNRTQNGSFSEIVSIYSLSKYFRLIKSSIKISYNSDIIKTPLIINSYFSTNLLDISTLSITSGTSLFKRKLNLSLAYKLNKVSSTWSSDENVLDYSRYFIKARISLSKNISWATDYSLLYFSDLNYQASILNSVIKIDKPKKKFSYTIKCNNILNTKAVKIIYLRPSLYSATNYPLQERFIIATLRYRF
ncbi:MAG: hypothetical protein L3J74_09470 [Bacteroidales bacterium]|nr:hypothetical protein [Bacteroidales bacterium]